MPGSFHTIETSTPQQIGNTRYDWLNWSNGGAISHGVMPMANTVYTATFSETPVQSTATISGRVLTPSGQGLRSTVVTLIDANNVRRTATTSSFGVYIFENVRVGENYVMTATSKRYRFAPRNLFVAGSQPDVDFVGLE